MRILNLTPFMVATKASRRRPPQPEVTVVVVGTYRLDDGETGLAVVDDFGQASPPSGDRFDEDDRDRECIHGSDFADFKLNGEVLVIGSCHPPGDKPIRSCPVRLRIGKREKLLRVVGDRHWEVGPLGRKPSQPEPFDVMPLRWSRAFGGEGYDDNPVGCGLKDGRLPNVELPGAPMQTPADRPKPAGLGPIHPDWPARRQYLGKRYDQSWRDTRAPYFAEDFDHRYFHAAPADQQIEGYFRGGETLGFDNLHPTRPEVSVTLPTQRVRTFFFDHRDGFHAVDLVLDTVTARLDEDRLLLTWRGVAEVPFDDPEVIRTLLLTTSGPGEAPMTEATAREVLVAYERDPAGVDEALEEARALAARQERLPELSDDEKTGNPLSDMFKRRLGDMAPDIQARVVEAIDDLRERARPEEREQLEQRLQEAADRAGAEGVPTARRTKPGAAPDTELRRQMRKVFDHAAKARQEVESHEHLRDEQREELLAKIAELETVPHDERLVQIDPTYTPPVEPLSTDEPGPGADLVERDLSDLDLSGRDLSGADLTRALLVRTNLRGANLRGAKLYGAVLYRANLDGADLTEADLTRIHGGRASAVGATLTDATLDECFLEDANLKQARLDGAKGQYAVMTRVNLEEAHLEGATLEHADLDEARLAASHWTGANLTRATFDHAHAPRASFAGATLTRASFRGASLDGAVFTDISAPESVWIATQIPKADFTGADLTDADMDKVSAPGATIAGARLRRARMLKAELDDADLSGSDLFEVLLDRARVSRTRFVEANLYGASLLRAQGKDADFRDAVLTTSSLERG